MRPTTERRFKTFKLVNAYSKLVDETFPDRAAANKAKSIKERSKDFSWRVQGDEVW